MGNKRRKKQKRQTNPIYRPSKEFYKFKWEITKAIGRMGQHGFNPRRLPTRTPAEIQKSRFRMFGNYVKNYKFPGLATITECDECLEDDVKQNIELTSSDSRPLSKELRKLKWEIRDSTRWMRQHGFDLKELPTKTTTKIKSRFHMFGKHMPPSYKPSNLRTIFECEESLEDDAKDIKLVPNQAFHDRNRLIAIQILKEVSALKSSETCPDPSVVIESGPPRCTRPLSSKLLSDTELADSHQLASLDQKKIIVIELLKEYCSKYNAAYPHPSVIVVDSSYFQCKRPLSTLLPNTQLDHTHHGYIVITSCNQTAALLRSVLYEGRLASFPPPMSIHDLDIWSEYSGSVNGESQHKLQVSTLPWSGNVFNVLQLKFRLFYQDIIILHYKSNSLINNITEILPKPDDLITNIYGRTLNEGKQDPLQLSNIMNKHQRHRRGHPTPSVSTQPSHSLTDHSPGILSLQLVPNQAFHDRNRLIAIQILKEVSALKSSETCPDPSVVIESGPPRCTRPLSSKLLSDTELADSHQLASLDQKKIIVIELLKEYCSKYNAAYPHPSVIVVDSSYFQCKRPLSTLLPNTQLDHTHHGYIVITSCNQTAALLRSVLYEGRLASFPPPMSIHDLDIWSEYSGSVNGESQHKLQVSTLPWSGNVFNVLQLKFRLFYQDIIILHYKSNSLINNITEILPKPDDLITNIYGRTLNEGKQDPLQLSNIMNKHQRHRRGHPTPSVSTQPSHSLTDHSPGILSLQLVPNQAFHDRNRLIAIQILKEVSALKSSETCPDPSVVIESGSSRCTRPLSSKPLSNTELADSHQLASLDQKKIIVIELLKEYCSKYNAAYPHPSVIVVDSSYFQCKRPLSSLLPNTQLDHTHHGYIVITSCNQTAALLRSVLYEGRLASYLPQMSIYDLDIWLEYSGSVNGESQHKLQVSTLPWSGNVFNVLQLKIRLFYQNIIILHSKYNSLNDYPGIDRAFEFDDALINLNDRTLGSDTVRHRRSRHTLSMKATPLSTSDNNPGIGIAVHLNDSIINYNNRTSNKLIQDPLQLSDRLNNNLRTRGCHQTPFLTTASSRLLTGHSPGILRRSDIIRGRRGHHTPLLSVTRSSASINNPNSSRASELNDPLINFDSSSNQCRQDPCQLSNIVDPDKHRKRNEKTSELSHIDRVSAEDQHATLNCQTRWHKLRSWICRSVRGRFLFIQNWWHFLVSWICRSSRTCLLFVQSWWQLLINYVIN